MPVSACSRPDPEFVPDPFGLRDFDSMETMFDWMNPVFVAGPSSPQALEAVAFRSKQSDRMKKSDRMAGLPAQTLMSRKQAAQSSIRQIVSRGF